MLQVPIEIDAQDYRKAELRAAEDQRSIAAVIGEFLRDYGTRGAGRVSPKEFARLERLEAEMREKIARDYPGFSSEDNLSREELYDPELRREERRAYEK